MKLRFAALAVSVLLLSVMFGGLVRVEAQGPTDYLAYWNFDEGTGTTVADASANGYDGTLYEASFVQGVRGSALDFDGVDDYVGIVNDTSLHNLDALTYEAWIYPRANSHWHVISKGTGSKRLYSEAWMTTLDLTGRVRQSTLHAVGTSVDNTVMMNSWQHVAMTWSDTNGVLRVYHNGQEVSYSLLLSGLGAVEDDSTHPYTIGGRSDLSPGCFFDGKIDEVYIWDRAMTSAQIQDRYEELVFPDPPRNLESVPDDGQITLTWEAPAFGGATPVTSYRIYRGTTPGALSFIYEVGSVFTYTDTSLTNGQTYYYEITAVNSAGESDPSNQTSATPAVTPSSPRNLTATFGNEQVQLDWLVPATDGGSAVTGYRVYGGTTSAGKALLIELGTTLAYTHTGLTNGQVYYYSVSALNTNGEGPNSTEVSSTPMAAPSAPVNLRIAAGNGFCHLTWGAPADDGGSPIINYTVYRSTTPGGGTELITLGNVLAYNDTNVINNQTYYYTVRATNAAGGGTASAEANALPSFTPTAPSGSEGIPLYLWIILLMIIILLVIVLVLLARRKGDRFESHPTEWKQSAAPPQRPGEPGPIAIEMGRNNLFLTENVDTTFRTFNGIINEGSPGLCLTNRYPENLRADFGLEDARIIWFSETGRGEDIFKPQRLEFEITRTTTQFIKDNQEPVILIDGLDYLILRNGFERVSTFLKKILDVAAMERATLVVIVRPDALNQEHVSYLKGQFDRVS